MTGCRTQKYYNRTGYRSGRLTALTAACFIASGSGLLAAEKSAPGEMERPSFDKIYQETDLYSVNDFGGVGLLQTRTARFSPDGIVQAGSNWADPFRHYYLTWQLTPWLETTFRYIDIEGSADLDRSLDVKVRLVRESELLPAIAVGIQDGLGSGQFGAEYLVASKRHYDFDFSFGIAWGYLGSRGHISNPMRVFGSSFKNRSVDEEDSGRIALKNFFSGNKIGFFGGVEYRTPLDGLSVKAEYNGANSETLDTGVPVESDFPVNIGLNYRPFPWVDLAVGFERGNTVMAGLTLRANLHTMSLPKSDPAPVEVVAAADPGMGDLPPVLVDTREAPPPYKQKAEMRDGTGDSSSASIVENSRKDAPAPPPRIKVVHKKTRYMPLFGEVPWDHVEVIEEERPPEPALPVQDVAKYAEPVFEALEEQGLRPMGLKATEASATVHVEAERYRNPAKNAGRAARVLAKHLPESVEELTVAQEQGGLETSRLTVYRSDLVAASGLQGSVDEIWIDAKLSPPIDEHDKASGLYRPERQYPRFSWDILPVIKQHLGDDDDGNYRAEVFATLRGQVELFRGLTLTGDVTQDLFGNLDKVPPRTGVNVPRVRSDIARYTDEGTTAITRLSADYLFSPDQNWYARVSAGIFETMYGGLGGEILYRPYGSNWAVGADLNWVKQRDFDQLFDFQGYDTVTGQASLYYEVPQYGLRGVASAGRYLAGDYGVTFDLSREFGNGIRLGAWATVTDMSRRDFGPGSYDKGIYLTIPFDVFWPSSSRRSVDLRGRALSRDGGQRLDIEPRLYDLLSGDRAAAYNLGWRDLMK